MSESQEFFVGGRALQCTHCGGARFTSRSAQLHTAFLSSLDLEFLNKTATVYVCADCGHLEWFLDAVQEGMAEAIECLECGEPLPVEANTCPKCGWTYKV